MMRDMIATMGATLAAGGWLAALVAPFIGSFAGVLIRRLPAERPVAWGRSACESCGHELAVPDLLPIASFIALRGRCRFCAAPIARTHFWVELAAMIVPLWAIASGQSGALLWASCALGWTLLPLAWIDAICLRLPDSLTLPLIIAGLAEAAWLEPRAIGDRAWGALCGYAGFRLLAWAFRRLRGREGLGQGDAKLLAAGGAWVGALALPDLLLGAALAALACALRRGRADAEVKYPFGPFLAVGIWVVWLYG